MLKQYQLFIGGKWKASDSGGTFRSVDPFTGEDWAEFSEGVASDVELAVSVAREAFDNGWWRRDPRRRAKVLQRLADLLEDNIEHLRQ